MQDYDEKEASKMRSNKSKPSAQNDPIIQGRLHIRLFIAVVYISIIIGPLLWIGWQYSSVGNYIKESLTGYLEKKFYAGLPFEAACVPEDRGQRPEVPVYVIGGTQRSLLLKFKTAVRLYDAGIAKKIWVLHTPGITAFDEILQRNLTNSEWAIKELTGQGVTQNDIEFIYVKEGFFGTASEAETLRGVALSRGLKGIVLVCSSYHARRVEVSFSAQFQTTGVQVELYTVEEPVQLSELLTEYLKLIVYENLVIPYKAKFD